MFLYFIIYALLILGCLGKDLPKNFPKCNRDDPNINKCIEEATESVRPFLVKGIPELNFEPLHSLLLSRVDVFQNISLANFTAHVTNATLNNMDNYKITDIEFDSKTPSIGGKIDFGNFSASCDNIDIDGTIAYIPLKGNGVQIQALLYHVKGAFKIIAKEIKVKDEEYWKVDRFDLSLKMEDVVLQFHGLFDGNSTLGDSTNNLLRTNSKMVASAITPALETLFSEYALRYSKWLTDKIPSTRLFPYSQ